MVNLYKKYKDDPNVNPYKTTYGSLLKMNSIEPVIQNFVNKLTIVEYPNYRYDVDYRSCHPIIITGRDDKERSLPPFSYPYGMVANNGEICIVVDIRDYINPKRLLENKPDSYKELLECANYPYAVECILSIGKMMANKFTGNDEYSAYYWKQLSNAYSSLLISLYNTRVAKLGILEQQRVSSVAIAYYYMKNKNNDILDINKFNILLQEVADKQLIESVYNYIITHQVEEFNGRLLTELLKEVVDPSKVGITIDTSLFSNAKGEWFGLSGSGIISMMMECDSLFIPILYYGLTNKSYSQSKIGMMLKNLNSKVKSDLIDGLRNSVKPCLTV